MANPARHKYPSGKEPQVNLRLPADLKERIAAAAHRNHRSVNAELLALLEQTYPAPPLAARGAAELIAYIDAATDEADWRDRMQAVETLLTAHHPGVRITADHYGTITIQVPT